MCVSRVKKCKFSSDVFSEFDLEQPRSRIVRYRREIFSPKATEYLVKMVAQLLNAIKGASQSIRF